jgi:PAS domain S-box-containing protein
MVNGCAIIVLCVLVSFRTSLSPTEAYATLQPSLERVSVTRDFGWQAEYSSQRDMTNRERTHSSRKRTAAVPVRNNSVSARAESGESSPSYVELTGSDRAEPDSAALLRGQNQVLEAIARGEPLSQTLDLLARTIESQSPGLIASILVLDPERLHVRHGAAPSLPPTFTDRVDGQRVGPRAGSCGTAAFRGEPVVVEDIATDPLWDDYREIALSHGLRACWSTPIFDPQRRVLGTFALYLRSPGRPHDRHWELIEMATSTAAIAIERKHADDEIARSEAQLAEAQRIAHLGSYEWVVATNIVYRSAELLRIFAVAADEFKPTFEGYLERVHPDDRAGTRTAIEHAFAERQPFAFEERIVRPDGVIRILLSQGRWVLGAAGEPVRLVGICQDITERRQAEERLRRSEEQAMALLEERVARRTAELHDKNLELQHEIGERRRVAELLRSKNEELKGFAYTVSHDLKAPLRGITGYAQELNRRHRTLLDDRANWCITQILTAAQNLDHLIEDLLHFSRLDAEVSTRTTTDLAALVDRIVQDRKPIILQQQADVSLDLSVTRIHTWERGLQQVLTNVFDNALKYSRHSRPPRVRIASALLDGLVRITVSDNGIGFEMKYHDRIFGLFNRLVRPEEFEGTGAGLAIVRKVMEKIGGSIRAESTPGSGTTFVIELLSAAEAER